ncbi:MAG: efflux RND transporter permease subunit [Bacteriovoracaceae bacterium]
MRSIIKFFVDRPVIVNLLTVVVFVAGLTSMITLRKEMFPPVEFDVILITSSYPGSSSEDVEKLVTIPIERKLKGIEGIKSLNALSAEGRAIIYLEVDPDANLEKVVDDVKSAVDTVDDLPEDATVPVVTSLSNKQRSVINIPIFGAEEHVLNNAAKKLRDRLERIPQVAIVNLDGYRPDEIRITVDPQKLTFHEVTIDEVYRAIKERNFNLTAGVIEAEDGDIMVRTIGEFDSLEEIKDLTLRSNTTGNRVTIGQVGEVTRVPQEGAVIQRSNGERAVFLEVKIKEKADIIDSVESIKKETEEFFKTPSYSNLKFRFADDLSYWVNRRLSVLKDNAIMGMGLVFACLLLFLNFRTSLMTSLGAPVAFMISFVVMDMMGLTINLISMFGLILVLGMLVDDSIIVAEQFYQKRERGLSGKKAAYEAASETVLPVIGTISTTIVAFGSLFFMGGIMGKFLWAVPAVVMICLAASLIECFVMLPSHLAEYCSKGEAERHGRWYDFLLKYYGKTLGVVLSKPKTIVFSFFVLFILSLGMAKTTKFELFPGDDVRTVFIQFKGKVGIPLEKTDEAMKKVESMALANLNQEEFDQIKSQVGVLLGDNGRKTGSHYGSLIVYLTPPDDRDRTADQIINDLTERSEKLLPDYTVIVKKLQGGPPRGKDIEVELTSDSIEELKSVSRLVSKELEKMEGASAIEIDFEEGKEQFVINVDDAEARRLGLSTYQIALSLRRAFSQDSITEIRESDEDVPIKVMLTEESRMKVESLLNLEILNNQGRAITLSRVAKIERTPGAFIIRRLDGKRIFSVSATLDRKVTTPVKIVKDFKPKIEEILSKFPNVSYNFGGENEDTQESMFRLGRAAVLSMFAIFVILVLMFGSLVQPLIIMSSIPLGLIGVIFTFKLTGTSLGFMAMMGVTALVGVVVNDSIVLVNFINEYRKEHPDLLSAVYEASMSRLRPVLLTTITTVAGLLPLAHPFIGRLMKFGRSVDSDPFLQPMALSFAWGLAFATAVTLIFVPSLYLIVEAFKERRLKKKLALGVSGDEEAFTTGTSLH